MHVSNYLCRQLAVLPSRDTKRMSVKRNIQLSVLLSISVILLMTSCSGSSPSYLPAKTPVSAADKFDRPDANPIGGNWTTVPGATDLQIVSGAVAGSVDGFINTAYWNADTFSDNQCSQVTLIQAGAGIYSAPVVRASHTEHSIYALNANGSTSYQIFRVLADVETKLGDDIPLVPASGDVLKICVSDTTISAYINGVLQTKRTDSTIASGSPGIEVSTNGGFTSTPTIDNWSGWDL